MIIKHSTTIIRQSSCNPSTRDGDTSVLIGVVLSFRKQMLMEKKNCIMKQKVFKIIIKHSRTSIQDSPTQKVGSAIKNSLAIDLRRVTAFRKAGPIFLQLTTISRFVICGLHILLSSARMYLIYVIFLCRTSLNLCSLMYCVEPKRIASSLH